MTKDSNRERAVEAAFEKSRQVNVGTTRAYLNTILQAAEPHLQRMFFERFREAMLSGPPQEAGRYALMRGNADDATVAERVETITQAALDKAQELMEGEDG